MLDGAQYGRHFNINPGWRQHWRIATWKGRAIMVVTWFSRGEKYGEEESQLRWTPRLYNYPTDDAAARELYEQYYWWEDGPALKDGWEGWGWGMAQAAEAWRTNEGEVRRLLPMLRGVEEAPGRPGGYTIMPQPHPERLHAMRVARPTAPAQPTMPPTGYKRQRQNRLKAITFFDIMKSLRRQAA